MNGRFVIGAGILALLFMSGCAGHQASKRAPAKLAWKTGVSVHDLSLQSLRQYKASGVECIEIGLRAVMNGTPEEQLKACDQIVADAQQAGITIWSVHIPFGKGWDISVTDHEAQQKALSNIRKSMELCRALRPRKAVIHASAEPIRDEDRPARLGAAHQALSQLTPEFAAMGVQLALEDLPRTCLGNTSDEVLWLVKDIQGLGVCLDTNHLLKESLDGFVRKVGARIVTMHASDYDRVDERHWMPGEGVNDWNLLVKSLKTAGYKGPFLFETAKHKDGTPIQPEEYATFVRKFI